MNKPIYVTQPSLPPLEEFVPYLEGIWDRKILTNGGPLHQELEQRLCDYLGVANVSLFNNGTIALLTALQALEVTGAVITTPYSFVATAHSLLWNGLQPIFVDIDPETMNIDAAKIEAAITPDVTAILPVHCYGNSCDVEAISSVARKNGLRVIYDAAHAFGVEDSGGSILRHGDLSVLSFHATKVFHTFEGGAIVSPDVQTKKRIDQLKNFGFVNEVTVTAPGINGKMSEVNAALGLLQLKYIDEQLQKRADVDALYRRLLADIPGLKLVDARGLQKKNFSYFPILIEDHYPIGRDAIYERLKAHNIYGRRYFYPLISEFPMYRGLESSSKEHLPNAHWVADRVICLPMYPGLSEADVTSIAAVLSDA